MPRTLSRPKGMGSAVLWDLLTFEHLMTSQVIHVIYWAGLALITLGAFGTIGAAVGVAIRDPFPFGLLLAIPVVIGGLLVMGALVLLWRSFCEFYVAIFKISEDLAVLHATQAGIDPHTYILTLGWKRLISYQPAGRFWTFQLFEAGLFVALSALIVVVMLWLVRRRPA